MQRQHGHRGREPNPRGLSSDIGEDKVRAGQHAERVEVMLAAPDPGRMMSSLSIERDAPARDIFGATRTGLDDRVLSSRRLLFFQRAIAEVQFCWFS